MGRGAAEQKVEVHARELVKDCVASLLLLILDPLFS